MFYGEYEHSLDIKNRIVLPSKFREELGDKFMITKGMDECIFVYSMSEWERIEQKLKQLPLNRKDARAFTRYFLSGAALCEPDKQGRILIPQKLLDHAKIDRSDNKNIMIIGVSTRIEIWNKQKWEDYSNDMDSKFDDIAENLNDIEI